MRSLPLDGHAHWLGKNIIYFESKIDSGIERAKIEFKKGDVAFLPSTGGVCFFLADTVFAKSMTPIGRLDGDIDVLKQTKSGDVLCIYEDTI